MSVEFNEPAALTRVRPGGGKVTGITGLIIKTGIVKTTTGAQVVLLLVAVACFVVAGILFSRTSSVPPAPTPAEVLLN